MLYGPAHTDRWEAYPMMLTWKVVGEEVALHKGPEGKGAVDSAGQMTKETQQSLGQLLHGSPVDVVR